MYILVSISIINIILYLNFLLVILVIFKNLNFDEIFLIFFIIVRFCLKSNILKLKIIFINYL